VTCYTESEIENMTCVDHIENRTCTGYRMESKTSAWSDMESKTSSSDSQESKNDSYFGLKNRESDCSFF